MKAYINHIFEMAIPRESDISKTYYHGTTKIKDAKDIINNGIKPPDITTKDLKSVWTPRIGKVYITPNLRVAVAYAVGGENYIANSVYDKEEKKIGFLFVIDGKELKDIEPDEDDIGRLLAEIHWKITNGRVRGKPYKLTAMESSILKTAEESLTPALLKLSKNFKSYAQLTAIGKQLIKSLSQEQMLWFISKGAHIAHQGIIKPKEAWRIELYKTEELKDDVSNFFQVAERIK